MLARDAQDALLHAGHALGRQLYAQVAARDYQRIGGLHDVFQVQQRGGLLDLGQQPRPLADPCPRGAHILRALHERQCDPVHAQRQREIEVAQVFLGQRRDRDHGIRHIDALAIRQRAAIDHACDDGARAGSLDRQPDLAVVEQQRLARCRRREQLGMRQMHARGIARRRIAVEHEALAARQRDAAPGESADAQFRTLQVGQDADRPAGLCLDRAHGIAALAMVVMRAVAEVQAEDVRAGVEQGADGCLVAAGGAQRGENLGAAKATHGGSVRVSRRAANARPDPE